MTQRRCSAATVRSYRTSLTELLEWLDQQGRNAAGVDHAIMRAYSAYLAEVGNSAATKSP